MKVIVTSEEDVASMNIRQRLLERVAWSEEGEFDGSQVFVHDDLTMILIKGIHLEADDLDTRVKDELGLNPECMIFASRHRSQSGLRTLTVHPLGNYGSADFGGLPGKVVPSCPRLMTLALLLLTRYARDLDFSISFETTHHGPYLDTPTFFIEIGSDESAWPETEPAVAIAKVILDLQESDITAQDEVGIGVGGGHYAPRHTDLVERMKVSVGHMVPNYALEFLDENMIAQIKDKTPSCSFVYFHKKAMKKPRQREVEALFEELGIRSVRSPDLEARVKTSGEH